MALELVDNVLHVFLKNDIPKYYLEALIQKIRIQIEKSQLNEAIDLVKQKEVILDSLPSEKLEELYQERYMLIHMEGIVNFHLGNHKRAVKLAKESLEIAEHYDYKFGIGLTFLFLGDCYGRLGQKDKSHDFREESLRIFTELDNQYWIAFVQHTIGHSYNNKGDYDKAIECFLQIMTFVDKTENAYQKITILYHLSYTYEHNLEPDIAYDYTLQAYQLLNKTDRLDLKRIILKKITRMSVGRGEIKKADEYFEELKPIIQQLDNSNFDLEIRNFELQKLNKRYFETHSTLILEEVESKLRELINMKQ
jgi:tetratricopeptide (TPR) repeat protein